MMQSKLFKRLICKLAKEEEGFVSIYYLEIKLIAINYEVNLLNDK